MNDKEKLRTDRTEDVKKVGFVIKILWIFVVVLFCNIAFASHVQKEDTVSVPQCYYASRTILLNKL